ncbi:SurA N-terminal domain-containing protein [Bacillus sp. P14.5]|uniref:SurA N-terminal domain-containing protein n=1 Tax=Bacillus sp. P14.5 TaxID=1983400 RepID=UPI000DE86B24|nr:SurA N-terminal domain-containing protein [Bacillus sp. P14.5]
MIRENIMVMLFVFLLLAGCGTGGGQNGMEVAEAMDEATTEEKMDRRVYSLENFAPLEETDKEMIRAKAMEQLINEYILMYEAKSQGFSVSYEEIQEVIEFYIETAKEIDNEKFTSMLDEMDMSIEEYYREYAYESIKGKLLENKLNDNITAEMKTPHEQTTKWNEYKDEVIKEFRKKNAEQIKKFTDERI